MRPGNYAVYVRAWFASVLISGRHTENGAGKLPISFLATAILKLASCINKVVLYCFEDWQSWLMGGVLVMERRRYETCLGWVVESGTILAQRRDTRMQFHEQNGLRLRHPKLPSVWRRHGQSCMLYQLFYCTIVRHEPLLRGILICLLYQSPLLLQIVDITDITLLYPSLITFNRVVYRTMLVWHENFTLSINPQKVSFVVFILLGKLIEYFFLSCFRWVKNMRIFHSRLMHHPETERNTPASADVSNGSNEALEFFAII